MIPASMGLRFQVPPDLVSFTITASWITYETVESGEVTKAGRTIASAIAVISSRLHRACPGATTANDRASMASLRRLS